MKKVLNDLYDYGLKIYQDQDNFKFSLDSILLAESVELKRNDKVLDFCTGNAAVPLILSTKGHNQIVGIEIQENAYVLAKESIEHNDLQQSISIINDNLINAKNYFPGNNFDIITCNPPFFKYNSKSLINENREKAIARHEITVKLNEIISTASYMLKDHGTFYIVYRLNRIQELINELTINNLFIKNMYLIKTNSSDVIETVIIKATKNGRINTKVKLITIDRNMSYKNIIK